MRLRQYAYIDVALVYARVQPVNASTRTIPLSTHVSRAARFFFACADWRLYAYVCTSVSTYSLLIRTSSSV